MKTEALSGIACFVLAVLGINAVSLGPAQLALVSKLGVSIADLSVLFVALSLGYLVSSPLLSLFAGRITQRGMLVSPALLVIALLGLALANSVGQLTVAAFVLGIGQALTQVAYLSWIGARLRGLPGASGTINRVNAFYGFGALLGPILVAGGIWLGFPLLAFWLAAALSAIALVIGLLVPVDDAQNLTQQAPERGAFALLRAPLLLGMLLTMAFYVGCEVAFSAYSTPYLVKVHAARQEIAAFATSLFFGGFAFSRYYANTLLSRVGDMLAMLMLFGVSAVGMLLMVLAIGPLVTLFGAMLVGLGFGPIYPTMLTIAIKLFPDSPRIVSSLVTSAGSVGSVTLPFVVGQTIDRSTSGPYFAWLEQLLVVGLATLTWLLVVYAYEHSALRRAQDTR
jgi:fucose permease